MTLVELRRAEQRWNSTSQLDECCDGAEEGRVRQLISITGSAQLTSHLVTTPTFSMVLKIVVSQPMKWFVAWS